MNCFISLEFIRVYKKRPEGAVVSVAGTGTRGYNGDGIPAQFAQLANPLDVEVATDGSVYIADTDNNRIRRIMPGGMITTVAGDGTTPYNSGSACYADGRAATQTCLASPRGIAVAGDGTFYTLEYPWGGGERVRRVTTDGAMKIVLYPGNRWTPSGGVQSISFLLGIDVDEQGALYLASDLGITWRIDADRTADVLTLRRTGGAPLGDGGPALLASADSFEDVVVGQRGEVYVADASVHRLRRIGTPMLGVAVTDNVVAAEDGSEVYVFNGVGKHVRTHDALTGAIRYSFSYGPGGLAAIVDGDGNVTTIERGADDMPTAIVSADGHRTALTVDQNGYLSSIANPADEAVQLTSSVDGLLETFTDARHQTWTFGYQSLGLLETDEDPAGGILQLVRTKVDDGHEIIKTEADGVVTRHVATWPVNRVYQIIYFSDGTYSSHFFYADGREAVRLPDETRTETWRRADPRWGMQAPVASNLTVTMPSGLTSTASE